jgi:hypothetical protein
MGALAMLAHVSPTLYNTWRRGGGPHTILHTATGDLCIAGIQGLVRPASIDRMRYRLTKKKIGQVSNPPSPQSQDSVRIHTYSCPLAGLLGHLHDACRRRQAMMPRSN